MEILEEISSITEFNDVHEFLQDEDIDRAMAAIIKLIASNDLDATKIPFLIVKLSAISTKAAIAASVYATIKKDKAGSDSNNKKNIYYSLKEALDKLVDSLKYLARYG